MNAVYENGKILLSADASIFNLAQTLECGQCFRWECAEDGAWHGVSSGKALRVRQTEQQIIFEGTTEEEFQTFWSNYFDLNTDYERIHKKLCERNAALRLAAVSASGLRILRQEPWETLCSFILSQNNNIPRIKKIIETLCSCFGEKLPGGEYSFPSAEVIAELSEEDLSPIKCGFRSKYLLDAAKKIAEGKFDLHAIEMMPTEEARKMLTMLRGVGPKVAECVLLYGFHRLEAFPVDVWMTRAMTGLFPGESPDSFGEYAGIAQQYIYYYSRLHPELFSGDAPETSTSKEIGALS